MAPSTNIGSRAQVMHGTAKTSSGGLGKEDLAYNKKEWIHCFEEEIPRSQEARERSP
ncbi:unnamed protein product [Ectocarpus sp. 4 AP-2014]